MKDRNIMKINIKPSDKIRLDELKFMVSAKQGRHVPDHEILRRMMNVPSMKDALVKDAELKRKRGFNY